MIQFPGFVLLGVPRFTGLRGFIDWGISSLADGPGPQRTFDACECRFGLFYPLVLKQQLWHLWEIPTTRFQTGYRAIRLRPDAAFRQRVLMRNWPLAVGLCLVLGNMAVSDVNVRLVAGILAMFCLVVSFALLIANHRSDARPRAIRLVLGPHAWGASDPATWHESICTDVVNPRDAFHVASFAELARQSSDNRQWAEGMWAARLSVALEDQRVGEELTDRILSDYAVQQALAKLRPLPSRRTSHFGPPVSLQQWLVCEPAKHIVG